MIYTIIANVTLIVVTFAVLGIFGKYTTAGEPKPRSIAITPLVILSAIVGIVAIVDSMGAALSMIIFISGIYLIASIVGTFYNE